MGKKYIIEKDDNESIWSIYADADGDTTIEGVSLTPYTAPDLEQVRKEAYEAGMNSNAVRMADDKAHESYQKGLSDAWDAARKICLAESEGGLSCTKVCNIFNTKYYRDALRGYPPAKAIEKIRRYEQEQEKQIRVGDEVQFKNTGSKFVITRIFTSDDVREDDKCEGLFDDGEVYESVLGDNVVKTGRHFPEIAAVLEKMRGEQDG